MCNLQRRAVLYFWPQLPEVVVTIILAEKSNIQYDDAFPLIILETKGKTTFLQSIHLSFDEVQWHIQNTVTHIRWSVSRKFQTSESY